ncbi:MAG TPA: nucleotidyltransferase family protein [Candidatus Acidoferrales bacterium]|nr:nucleotidyltransferase family protein [Candidatus Acidoferrales bacterium]
MIQSDGAVTAHVKLEVVKLLSDSATEPRVAMRGSSMMPLLHEPMLLKLGPSGSDDRVGDILVFKRDGKLVAHRITRLRHGAVQTCGDAQPWSPDYPEAETIVGKVIAVIESDRPDARRLDTLMFRLRGLYKAHFRAMRAIPFRCKLIAGRFAWALPWLRRRPYVTLVQAMSAVVREDNRAWQKALSRKDASAIVAVARRHACSAMLVEAAATLGNNAPAAQIVQRSLQEAGRNVVLHGLALKSQVNAVTALLARAAIPFVLLKGAARIYRDEPGAALHASSDIDVLVAADQLEAAIAALRAQGYAERSSEQVRKNYRAHHHHYAPLFPTGPGFAVEVHWALAIPGTLSLQLDWSALEPYMTWVEGAAGAVRCLDNVGSALHYAVHSVGLKRLRDSVLLAELLRRMDASQIGELQKMVSHETADRIRLSAAVAIAARMAGVSWSVDGDIEEYLRWSTRREDEPIFIGQRSQLPEGWYAGGRRVTHLMWRLLYPKPGPDLEPDRLPTPLAVAGRVLTSIVAYAYAQSMRPAI